MTRLAPRPWVPVACETRVQSIAAEASQPSGALADRIGTLAAQNAAIHDDDCFNLNPAANVMNPRAEALQACGLGSRPSLGYPGDKYEMGLEAAEQIETLAAELAAQVFDASYAEIRCASGAMANLYAFMALTKPGDAIIAPPASVGGHVTHHGAGCAGLYGLVTHPAPVDADGYTVDLDALRGLAQTVRPKLITIGGSLNLFPHPVAEIAGIARDVGAAVLFDAAHLCGMIAGRAWTNPLDQGADLMTMSTYKSLGGPAGGLIVTRNADVAQRLDAIAFPGMTANFDLGKTAALAMGLLDWRDHGAAYAGAMVTVAQALAQALHDAGLPVFAADRGFTRSHQFALMADAQGGGHALAKHLRKAGFLASAIGLPTPSGQGLRLGTPEIVRRGVTPADVPQIAALLAEVVRSASPETIAPRTKALRAGYTGVAFVNCG